MPLIAGLGNPDPEYAGTPHNVGFAVLERLAGRLHIRFRNRPISKAATAKLPGDPPVILLRPLSYMNRSGEPVKAALRYYQLTAADLLVVCDDVNLPPGTLRLRQKGGAGGQKGLKSIIRSLDTEEFPRLRIGVGGGHPGADVGTYVLSKLSKTAVDDVQRAIETACDAAECFLNDGLEAAMNRFNTQKTDESASPSDDGDSSDNACPQGKVF